MHLQDSDGWRRSSGVTVFTDRDDAGTRLGREVARLRLREPVVLGLPRGGVPVAARVASELRAPLDVLVVRKLGVPGHPEVAMGAIGECGVRVIDQDFIDTLGIPSDDIAAVERRERKVLEARVQRLRGAGAPLDLTGRTALIVDDGIATGASATAACQVARALGAARVIVAAPVGSAESASRIQGADDVVCLLMPRDFAAVGYYYLHFDPTSDDEVAAILRESRPGRGSDDRGIG